MADGRPYDEDDVLTASPLDARDLAADLPLDTRFRLHSCITPVQHAFLRRTGFLVFDRAITGSEVQQILAEMTRVEDHLRREGVERVHGVPVWWGVDDQGRPWLQRMGFSSVHSPWLEDFLHEPRFEPVRRLIGATARIGTREKDGVVYNRYINRPGSLRPDLPWHTDTLRDVFYNRARPGPMLNVGIHLDRIRPEDGGLRLLPGTHEQTLRSTLFRKLHFVTNDDDPAEVMVETWPGDLTVHDGRMWHRVKSSPHVGERSLRRTLYIPFVADGYAPKSSDAKTNAYMKVFDRIMRWRSVRARNAQRGK